MRSLMRALPMAAVLAVAACAPSPTPSPAPTATTSPAASAALASPSPSPLEPESPSPSTASPTTVASPVGPPACTSADLTAAITGWQGAMGSQIATVKLVNASASACRLQGTPQLQLVDAAEHVLLDSAAAGDSGAANVAPGDRAWTIGPGESASTMVRTSNYCGSVSPVTPTTVAFILPSGGGRLLAKADPHGDVPGCNGSPGDPGSIAMNGWTTP